MLQTIVLICAVAIDHSACSTENAIYAFAFPPERGAICGPASQETVARMALKPEPGVSYAKTVCSRYMQADAR